MTRAKQIDPQKTRELRTLIAGIKPLGGPEQFDGLRDTVSQLLMQGADPGQISKSGRETTYSGILQLAMLRQDQLEGVIEKTRDSAAANREEHIASMAKTLGEIGKIFDVLKEAVPAADKMRQNEGQKKDEKLGDTSHLPKGVRASERRAGAIRLSRVEEAKKKRESGVDDDETAGGSPGRGGR